MDSPTAASDGSLVDIVGDLIEEKDAIRTQSKYKDTSDANSKLEDALKQLSIRKESMESLLQTNSRLQLKLAEKEAIAKIVTEENRVIKAQYDTVTSEIAELSARNSEIEDELVKLKAASPTSSDKSTDEKGVGSEEKSSVAEQTDKLVELSVGLNNLSNNGDSDSRDLKINNVIYRVSKRLLCQESEHFEKLLSEDSTLGDKLISNVSPIVIEGVSEFEMKTFLEFLYAS